MYGRTGIMPDTSIQAGNEFADPNGSSSTLMGPGTVQRPSNGTKATQKYGLLSGGGSGETLRSLSPAEQVGQMPNTYVCTVCICTYVCTTMYVHYIHTNIQHL